MDYYSILIPPISGALIGWVTNYVAIKLLFRPHRAVKLFGFKVQGIIPKRRKEIARSIANVIEKELLSSEDLAGTLKNIDWKGEIERAVEDAVEHRIGSGRIKKIPLVGVVTEGLKDHIKYLITKEVLRQVESKKGNIAASLKDKVNVKEMLVTRIDRLDLHRFEGLLTEFIARELKYLEWLGGIMGFLIGCAQSIFYLAKG